METRNMSRANSSGTWWDTLLAVVVLALLSAGAVRFVYQHGYILYYGDAAAHLNIARRVPDSRPPTLHLLLRRRARAPQSRAPCRRFAHSRPRSARNRVAAAAAPVDGAPGAGQPALANRTRRRYSVRGLLRARRIVSVRGGEIGILEPRRRSGRRGAARPQPQSSVSAIDAHE